MKRVVQIVDSVEYIAANCFQHQLARALGEVCNLTQVPLHKFNETTRLHADVVVSCLKQRTIAKHAEYLGSCLRGQPIVVYDQDPWESFMDSAPGKGAYDHIAKHINIKFFALTTKWWVDFLSERNYPTKFVRMWVLPEYCDAGRPFEERIAAGFIGSLHPRRKELVDICKKAGVDVNVIKGNSLPYVPFLKEMSRLGIFVHNEDMPIYVDGKELNFNTGMWVKDVEAISRGCFSIRSKADGWDTYLSGLETAVLYDNIRDVPDLIRAIQVMDPAERRNAALRSVQAVQKANVWHETALSLIS